MSTSALAMPSRQEGQSVGFTLAVIALVVAMGGVALAYTIDAVGRREQVVDGTLTRTLGAAQLDIPVSWFREDAERAGGFAKQVELSMRVPLGAEGAMESVEVTLVPRSRVRPSASLLDGVYLHQFMPEQVSGPPGLIGKPLVPRDGFAGETVWYDAISPAPFVAKCIAPVAEGVPGRCLRTVFLGTGVAAVYAFNDGVLANWRRFDAELQPLMKQIGAL